MLIWIKENGHKLADVAAKIGYSRGGLSRALHEDRITPHLSQALMEHFWLRVPPNTNEDYQSTSNDDSVSRGRRPGRGTNPRPSKLDLHLEEITALRKEGATLTAISLRYGTSLSTLHDWMKKNGILHSQTKG